MSRFFPPCHGRAGRIKTASNTKFLTLPRIGLEARLEGDVPRLEGVRMVYEPFGRPAKLIIIVKTLNRTRAIKGFYYDENDRRLAKHLVNVATHLDTAAIDVCTRATIDCSLLIDDCRPDERHCRPRMNLVTPPEAFDTPASYHPPRVAAFPPHAARR